jgi:hypothetical protein
MFKIGRPKDNWPPQLQLHQYTKCAGLNSLNRVQFTKVNGKVKCRTVTENKNGLTAPGMRVLGETVKQMARASCTMLTVMCTKAIGKRIRPTAEVSTPMPMVRGMSESGKMTSKMVKDSKLGPMVLYMKEIILRAKNMGQES